MRWVVKTSLDGAYCDELIGEGSPAVPEQGAELMLPTSSGAFVPGIVSEVEMDQSQSPAVLRIICVSPESAGGNEFERLRRSKPS